MNRAMDAVFLVRRQYRAAVVKLFPAKNLLLPAMKYRPRFVIAKFENLPAAPARHWEPHCLRVSPGSIKSSRCPVRATRKSLLAQDAAAPDNAARTVRAEEKAAAERPKHQDAAALHQE